MVLIFIFQSYWKSNKSLIDACFVTKYDKLNFPIELIHL